MRGLVNLRVIEQPSNLLRVAWGLLEGSPSNKYGGSFVSEWLILLHFMYVRETKWWNLINRIWT